MACYPKDAAAVQRLREQIEALGVALVLMRKFNQLIGAITVQVEGEYTSRKVIATVFAALVVVYASSNCFVGPASPDDHGLTSSDRARAVLGS